VLEFNKVIGRILQEKALVLFLRACKARERFPEKGKAHPPVPGQELFEGGLFPERDTKMPGVDVGLAIDLFRCQVTNDLVAEKIQSNPVFVGSRQHSAQFLDIELPGFFKVAAGDGQVENGVFHRHRTMQKTKYNSKGSGEPV
jgi:hypothetical protein